MDHSILTIQERFEELRKDRGLTLEQHRLKRICSPVKYAMKGSPHEPSEAGHVGRGGATK